MKKIPRYFQIARWIREKIDKGEWVIGSKIPTQREIAEQFGVNRSTVVTAIEMVKSEGLLEGKTGSGIYVVNNQWSLISAISPPDWNDFTKWSLQPASEHTVQMINELENRKDLIQFSKGELGPEMFPHAEITEAMGKVTLQLQEFGYGDGLGELGLRTEISRHLQRIGVNIAPESILIVSGALHALKLITTGILKRGSTVFLESPSYLHSINLFPAEMAIREIPVAEEGLNIKELFQQKFTKNSSILFLNPTFQNPTSTSMTLEQRKILLDKCQYYQLPIIEDDIFRDLWLDAPPPAPLKALDKNGQVLYVGSFSKTIAAGLRIGWLAGPEAVVKRLSDVRMQTDYGSSYLSQVLVKELLASGMYEKHLQKVRCRLREKRDELLRLLSLHLSDVATWSTPSGGFFIWVVFKKKMNMQKLFKQCLAENVVINPGFIYNDRHSTLRLSFAYATFEEMEAGILTIKSSLSNQI
ncbi:aminotransferase-like domain-containing protein [Neobacillus kokaensis]|uniref:HTH-type transcriptional regulator YdfD n=1 Tax=Neobacillus kokaensis TaxID=2759023 RepID=A0ABQ3MZ78_9BACI|nr:PLP-dependent aminotransferase family protein [Neobacillus kokaensis]GHH97599.1 putative HTH-type transcriptional regulator YdfD [Neobacillus kokaensis]